MTIPQTNIAMTAIRAEFGGVSLTPLSSYLKGGAFVPVQTLAPIPSALPIAIHNFAGAVFPAAIAYTGNTPSGGYSTGSAVVAPDLSAMTFVLTRTKTNNGGASTSDTADFLINFSVSGAANPNIVLRLNPIAARDANGFWKIANNYDFQKVVSPAGFNPLVDYAAFDHNWHAQDVTTTYQGELRISTPLPTGNDPTPPSRAISVVANAFSIRLTVSWSLDRGTAAPPGSSISWNTRNGTNTFIEVPLIIDVYDGAVLRASYTSLLHFELNSTFNFNPS